MPTPRGCPNHMSTAPSSPLSPLPAALTGGAPGAPPMPSAACVAAGSSGADSGPECACEGRSRWDTEEVWIVALPKDKWHWGEVQLSVDGSPADRPERPGDQFPRPALDAAQHIRLLAVEALFDPDWLRVLERGHI
ncbi:hypothetical protein GB937_010652 [Aspergillus fischeri]|nr:hypothetical protein GB937_010652 [Aspergillus fischeri]